MRLFLNFFFLLVCSIAATGQGTPPVDPERMAQLQGPEAHAQGEPPEPGQAAALHRLTGMMKTKIKQAIDGKSYPSLQNWRPLTTREKFDVFLKHTYAGRTFASAAIDASKDNIRNSNNEYERGLLGFGQRYGVELGINETGVFFEQFLVPATLRQDPRYFRNPELPRFKRTLYSLSRVLVTRADNGHSTFNASRIVGGAVSQALADLYVPGKTQGLSPIVNRVAFGLLRDSGLNLMHEFWPDLRRKFLHR
jgi:hypothetical protein